MYGLGVKILWVPGHAGVEGNEKADSLAKLKAKNVYDDQQLGEHKLSLSGAIQLSKKLAVKAWQRYWERCEGAVHTKQLVPYVTTKVLLPADRKTGVMYCRLLLGDTMLNEDCFRCGFTTSPICECGSDRESIEHFLLFCPKYSEQRNKLYNTISDLWLSSYLYGALDVSVGLLLGPGWDHRIARKDDEKLKVGAV